MTFDPRSVRTANLHKLKAAGFAVAPHLPLSDGPPQLRPFREIAGRLAALNAVFIFLVYPPERYATQLLLRHIRENGLDEHMTDRERSLINMDRAEASDEVGDGAGWSTENCLSLAWILGGGLEPTIDGAMLDHDTILTIVLSPPFGGRTEFEGWSGALKPRSVEAVAAMDDLFYCCHNAARSAQVELMESRGKSPQRYTTVPADFDPIANGGVIHERRHALSWALSPGVEWDDVDLST